MMRLVGITLTPNGNMDQTTLLLRSPFSLAHPNVRQTLPYFFCQSMPSVGVLPEGPLAIRIKTNTDPFEYLRDSKCPPFDGRGITLERYHQRPDLIRIDHALDLTVKQFQLQCPGLFYGTVKYPNLNLLVSERRFYANLVDPVRLWDIIYDCLCCHSFRRRQGADDDFKRELSNKFYTTQVYDCQAKLEELQERTTASSEQTRLAKSLDGMIDSLRSMEVQRCTKSIERAKLELQSIATEKQQQVAARISTDSEIDFATLGECSKPMIVAVKDDVENMLHVSEIESQVSREYLDERIKYDECQSNLHTLLGELQEMQSTLGTYSSLVVENARCAVENNLSLQMLANVPDVHSKTRYLRDLQNQEQILSSRIGVARKEVELTAREISSFAAQLQALKQLIGSNEDSTAPVGGSEMELDMIINRFQENLNYFLKASVETARLEQSRFNAEKLAWQEYMSISSIPYNELVSIAATNCAIDDLGLEIEADFEGFIYERALEVRCEVVWLEGFSLGAIFKSSDAASRVERLMKQRYNTHPLHYTLLERCRSSTVSAKLMECAKTQLHGPIREGDSNVSYEELITKVNIVVAHLQQMLEVKRKLKSVQETRDHYRSEQAMLLNSLIRWQRENQHGNFSNLRNSKCNDLPTLIAKCTNATNEQMKLQARADALKSLIQQIDSNILSTDIEQLKLDEVRLTDQLKNAIKENARNRKSFYEHLGQLSSMCDVVQFELARYAEHCSLHSLSWNTCRQLVDHWDACGASLRRDMKMIDDILDGIAVPEMMMSTMETVDTLDRKMQALHQREHIINERVKASQAALNQYIEEYPARTRFTKSGRASNDHDDLLDKIVQAQKQLQAMQPAYKPNELAQTKNKCKILLELQKLQSTYRDVHMNNLILPVIDKLYVRKLQEIAKMVATVSEDLPELGGTVKVFFDYHDEGERVGDRQQEMSARPATFRTNQINAVNVSIHDDDDGRELETIDEKQQHLAFLLVFISFLHSDGCRLFIVDERFQNLFENGILGMREVFEKHFPTMQCIVLGSNVPRE